MGGRTVVLSEMETVTGPAGVLTHDFSIGRRGYDPEEVHAHLRRVADQVGRLQSDLDRRRAREELLERKIASAQEAAYARVFRHLMEVMRAAEEAGSRIRGAAEDEAQAILAAAREEAARIAAAARGEADQLLATARTETARAKAVRMLREATVESDGLPVFPSETGPDLVRPPAPAPAVIASAPTVVAPAPVSAAVALPQPAPAELVPRSVPSAGLVVSVQEPAVVRDLEELGRRLRWLSEEEWETGDVVTFPTAPAPVEDARPGEPDPSPRQDRAQDLSLRLQASVLQLFAESPDDTAG
jgi:DivIVA domain-containing protein